MNNSFLKQAKLCIIPNLLKNRKWYLKKHNFRKVFSTSEGNI